MTEKKFRVSSALKNIIGRELITDDLVAVFELVKNSFDANAKTVTLTFEGLKSGAPKLIIQDDGKGMDQHAIDNKWLFVAYSAKKDGSEDYRDKIKSKRIHAGAKGIGRFSCDKLGTRLRMYSRKSPQAADTNFLEVDWSDFEGDSKRDFIEIPVHHTITVKNPYKIKTGTVLEISGLRENWDRKKLLKLKSSLEKLINPNQGNDSKNFAVELVVPDEIEEDKQVDVEESWNIVNGSINNFLFEKLGMKTTFINVKVTPDGKTIHTRLEDRGTLIFEISEKNPIKYKDKYLSDIEISLFALNTAAKTNFTRIMGTRPINYGSIFLYKNGFRIHPFGEYGYDTFGIDTRKTQGVSRFLGSRDLIGRIELNGVNSDFSETSSRDGGLVKNEAYHCLQHLFREYCLKRLEKYAVDIVKYGNLSIDLGSENPDSNDIKSKVLALVRNLTSSDDIIDVRFDPKVFDVLSELSEKSLQTIFSNFSRIAIESNNEGLAKEAKKAEKRLNQLNASRIEAETEAKVAKKAQVLAEKMAVEEAKKAFEAQAKAEENAKKVEQKTSQNLFLKTMVSADLERIVELHHHVNIAAGTIQNYIENMVHTIRTGGSYSEATILELLGNISKQAKKIETTARWATKANFKLATTKLEADICSYVEEYIMNICTGVIRTKRNSQKPIEFLWRNPENRKFQTKFRALELSMVIDNLISNSRKAGATEIVITVAKCSNSTLQLLFSDNGSGIPMTSTEKIFEFGYTTTDGSGLGLHQTRSVLNEMKASIELEPPQKNTGAQFLLEFKK